MPNRILTSQAVMQVVHEAQQTSKIRQIASFYSELLYLPSCGHIVATYQLK
jgi:hypothetical protein